MLGPALVLAVAVQLAGAAVYGLRRAAGPALAVATAIVGLVTAAAIVVMVPHLAFDDLADCAAFGRTALIVIGVAHVACLAGALGCSAWVIRRALRRRTVSSGVFGEVCLLGLALITLSLLGGGSSC